MRPWSYQRLPGIQYFAPHDAVGDLVSSSRQLCALPELSLQLRRSKRLADEIAQGVVTIDLAQELQAFGIAAPLFRNAGTQPRDELPCETPTRDGFSATCSKNPRRGAGGIPKPGSGGLGARLCGPHDQHTRRGASSSYRNGVRPQRQRNVAAKSGRGSRRCLEGSGYVNDCRYLRLHARCA